MSNTVIKIENLSKIYRLGEVGTGTLSHDLNRWFKMNLLGQEDPYAKIGHINDRTQKAEKGELVAALRDINLEVKEGEVLGIIGKNGAGKSTLLKLLSRVTSPTTGSIKVKGRLASLLEVGTGFHPEMTGRENIYMNGTIMGMRKWEIDRRLDEIVDFAGVAKYLDTPTKRYSSGMTVRLGFAIAAHLEPEILVVDEVLAVGDAEFQKKAIGKMQDVSQNQGRTVLFVSHNMPSIQQLCNRVFILENGKYYFDGNAEEGVRSYLGQRTSKTNTSLRERNDRNGNGLLRFTKVIVKNDGVANISLQTASTAEFQLCFEIKQPIENVVFRLIVLDGEGNIRFLCNSYHLIGNIEKIESDGSISLKIKNFPLPPGNYFYHVLSSVNTSVSDEIEFAGEFNVESGDFFHTGKLPFIKGGVFITHEWNF